MEINKSEVAKLRAELNNVRYTPYVFFYNICCIVLFFSYKSIIQVVLKRVAVVLCSRGATNFLTCL